MNREVENREMLASRCVETLHGVLRSEEFWPSMHAAEALTLAGSGHEVRTVLIGLLKTETDVVRRCGLAREIVRTGDRSVLSILWDAIATGDGRTQTVAAEGLFKVREAGDGSTLRRIVSASDNVVLQLMATGALWTLDAAGSMSFIRQGLAGEDPQGQKIAAWIIAQVGDASDVPLLLQNIDRDLEPLTQAYLFAALACHGGFDGHRRLAGILTSTDPVVRATAAEFLGHSGGSEFFERLISTLR